MDHAAFELVPWLKRLCGLVEMQLRFPYVVFSRDDLNDHGHCRENDSAWHRLIIKGSGFRVASTVVPVSLESSLPAPPFLSSLTHSSLPTLLQRYRCPNSLYTAAKKIAGPQTLNLKTALMGNIVPYITPI